MALKKQILIVDDDQMSLDILNRLFMDVYDLRLALSAEQALDILQVFRPDLIISDLVMPGLSGYDFCEKLRDDDRYRLTKIILVSGKARLEERLKGYEVGADDYIVKPFHLDEIEARVKILLNLKRSEEVDRMKSNLLTLLSHEARTPLTGIIGASDLIMSLPEAGDDIREYADMIKASGRRLLDFIEKTVTLCGLRDSTCSFQRETLSERLHSISANTRLRTGNQGISLRVEAEDQVELDADWESLEMALGFIIENALRFSPPGGEVVVSGNKNSRNVIITVTDEGPGVAPDMVRRIFEGFTVGDIDHHYAGQGLSLAIAAHVVDQHNGVIKVESIPGKKTSFIITLPGA